MYFFLAVNFATLSHGASKYSSGQMCRCSITDSIKTSPPAEMSRLKVASPARMSNEDSNHLPESSS